MPNYQDQIDSLAERVAALEASGAIPGPSPREPQPEAQELFDALRVWRRERAQADEVQAFQVFGNAILTAIATARPADKFELSKIKGIGDQRIALYGDEVLGIVRGTYGDW